MSQVQGSNRAKEQHPGKENQVISVTTVEVMMFKFTDQSGQADVGIALSYGTEADGKPGVVVIEPRVLKELLSVPHKFVKEGVRRFMASREAVEAPPELPSELPSFEP